MKHLTRSLVLLIPLLAAPLAWAAAPANDLLQNAILLEGDPVSVNGTTIDSTIDTGETPSSTCGTTIDTGGVWYKVFGGGGAMTADTCGAPTNYDSKLSVFSGQPGSLVCITGNDDACALQSSINWPSVLGQPYYILVHGFVSAKGTFGLEVTGAGSEGEPPVNGAAFYVTKDFTDDNTDAVVNLTLSCDDGLPIKEDQNFSDGETIRFVVTNFDDGMNCHVEEEELDGYTSDVSACIFNDVSKDTVRSCTVYNRPDLVELEICKEWVTDNASGGGSEVDQGFELRLTCDNPIPYYSSADDSGSYYDGQDYYWVEWEDSGDVCDTGFTAAVLPDWDGNFDEEANAFQGTNCWVDEDDTDGSVETDTTDCEGLYFAIGSDDQSCTVVNTVFYEGIPTLSQYGMAIMALLMLGAGLVGFRRLV